MENIKTEKIKVRSNPRKDFGDLTELACSIEEHGILEPLLINKDFVLICGERRLRVAKRLSMSIVPCEFIAVENEAEIKLVENIHRKNLNPIEECNAFNSMYGKGTSVDNLAKKIAKPKLYIERRLALLDLDAFVKNALIEGKILLGHALLLAKFPKQDQAKKLKEITRDNYSVQDARERIADRNFELKDACFNLTPCKGCKSNGGEQAILYDIGNELRNYCLDPKCYMYREREWVEIEKKKLKELDIKIVISADLEKHVSWKEVSEYDKEEHKNCEKGIMFKKDYSGRIKKVEVCIGHKMKGKTGSNSIQQITKDRKQKLEEKIQLFKQDLLAETIDIKTAPGSKEAKIITFVKLTQGQSAAVEEAYKVLNINYRSGKNLINALLKCKPSKLDEAITLISNEDLYIMDLEELVPLARSVKMDFKIDFVINKEFLTLHTKDQLKALVKELKIKKTEKIDTKAGLITTILAAKIKRKVPKVMGGLE